LFAGTETGGLAVAAALRCAALINEDVLLQNI